MNKLKQIMQRFFVYSYINKQEENVWWKRYLTSIYQSDTTKFWKLNRILLRLYYGSR